MIKRTIQQKILYYTNPRFYHKLISELGEVEERIVWMMRRDERYRNSDTLLVLDYQHYFNGFKAILLPSGTQNLTNFETITRKRRELQQLARKHKELSFLLPTDPEVIEKRRFKEKVYRDYFGGKQ
jgi:hypothetical protein